MYHDTLINGGNFNRWKNHNLICCTTCPSAYTVTIFALNGVAFLCCCCCFLLFLLFAVVLLLLLLFNGVAYHTLMVLHCLGHREQATPKV